MDVSSVDPTTTPGTTTPNGTSSGTSSTGTSTGETTTQKLLGDPSVDITDATYRFVADSARSVVYRAVRDQFPEFKSPQLLELIVGYVLAAAVEVAPIQALQTQRQRLAQNLRVQTYQDIENTVFEWGEKRFDKLVADRRGDAERDISAVLQQVQHMINEAQHRTDRHIDHAIEQAIERMKGA